MRRPQLVLRLVAREGCARMGGIRIREAGHGVRMRDYWFDETGRGEVRVPTSWRLLYKNGNEWNPVLAANAYGVEKDQYNRVLFAPVTTSGLRLELSMQPKWSTGLERWKVK